MDHHDKYYNNDDETTTTVVFIDNYNNDDGDDDGSVHSFGTDYSERDATMVEFGLKLDDNKVSEWSDRYLRYETLKGFLKKAGNSLKRYNDLARKRPEVASKVEEAFRTGMPTPHGSKVDLAGSVLSGRSTPLLMQSPMSTTSLEMADAAQEATGLMGSISKLLTSSQRKDYGSGDVSGTALTRVLESAASGVSDYFSKGYERQVMDALKSVDKYEKEFETCLLEDIDRVNSFYKETMSEFEGRLHFLKESVAQSFGAPPPPPPPSSGSDPDAYCVGGSGNGRPSLPDILEEEYLTTPLVQNRKSRNSVAKAIGRISQHFHPNQQRKNKFSVGPERATLLGLVFHSDEGEDEHHKEEGPDAERRAREIDSIQRSLVDLYRRTKLLHNYSIINYTGFVKIVKKYDKTLPSTKGKFKQMIKPANICNEGKCCEELAEHIEMLYANWFCDRSVSEARVQLLPKKGDGLETDWSQLRLGYRMGMSSVLGLWVAWDCIWGMVSSGTSTIGGRTAFPVFRACGGLLLLQWFWGCSVWVWTRYRVNYIFLFDFNPQIVASPLSIFNEAVDNSLVFLFGMLLYYKAGAHQVPGNFPAGIFPAALVAYTTYQLIFPLRVRGQMWRSIWCVISTPLSSPTFFHGYVGDIFTSMVKVFQDIAWSLCFLGSGDWLVSEDSRESTKHSWSKTVWYSQFLIPVLTLLPLWFRFNQCLRRYTDTRNRFPHVPNAFKYALSMTVTLFGAFHPLYLQRYSESILFQLFWTMTFVSSSLYSFLWDVYADWGLGRLSFNFLGPRLMYPNRSSYYAVIVMDLILRFAWVLTLVPPNSGAHFALPQYLTAVSMSLELFRRTIWGFLRLENEHRSNTSGYRRVDFVPLHFRTEHTHGYKAEKEHRGFSVLVEVAAVTVVVLAAAVASVVAAQHETERMMINGTS